MSDRRDASGSGTETTPEPPSSQTGGRAEEADRQTGDTWLDRLRAVVGLRPSSIREELEDALEDEQVLQGFSPEERLLLHNTLELREVRVEDIMVPRAEVDAVDADTTLAELLTEFRDCGHSRMPVYRESLDDPLGMVHIKDLLSYLVEQASFSAPDGGAPGLDLSRIDLSTTVAAAGLVREVLFVPPSMPVATLLATMQSSRMQMALVIDEYGGTDGVVSIEDAVETVVGEIEDEHDEEEVLVVPEADGVFVADGRADLDEVAEKVGPAIAAGERGEEVETIGGLVFSLLGRIPSVGEMVEGPEGYRFEILDTDPRRISRVRIFQPGFGPAPELPQERPAAFG